MVADSDAGKFDTFHIFHLNLYAGFSLEKSSNSVSNLSDEKHNCYRDCHQPYNSGNIQETRMHSSRMCTTRSLTYLGSLSRGSLSRGRGFLSRGRGLCPGGGVSFRGFCPGGGVSVQGGFCPGEGFLSRGRGLCPGGGVSVRGRGLCPGGGVSVQGEGSLSGGGVSVQGGLCLCQVGPSGQRPPPSPVDRMTDTSKDISLPQTSFAALINGTEVGYFLLMIWNSQTLKPIGEAFN